MKGRFKKTDPRHERSAASKEAARVRKRQMARALVNDPGNEDPGSTLEDLIEPRSG